MKTLHQEMVEYIKLQIEEEEGNYFSLNYCKLPIVVEAIKALNYVDIDFIRNYFGVDTVVLSHLEAEVFDIETWNLTNMVVSSMNDDFNLTHSPDSTIVGIFTDLEDRAATEDEIAEFAQSLIDFLEQINEHYVKAIDARLKDAFI